MSDDPFIDAVEDHGLDLRSAREAAEVPAWLHSGNYALNYVMSGRFSRGYPLGHAVEMFGSEGTGKSFLVARAVAEAQEAGGHAVIDDTEGAFNPEWAEKALGVDVDALGLKHSATVENHFDLADQIFGAVQDILEDDEGFGPFALACDSLSNLSTEDELEGDFGDPGMLGAKRAKLIKRLFRELSKTITSLPVLYMLTSHKISSPDPFSPDEAPGGGGPKHYASVRLELKSTKKLKRGGDVEGVRIRVHVKKNRLAPPFREVPIVIPYHRPISQYSGLIPLLLEVGFLGQDGHTLVYDGEDTGIYAQKSNPLKREQSAEDLVEEYPEILERADEFFEEREQQRYLEGD